MSQLKWPAAICSRAKQVSRGWGKQTHSSIDQNVMSYSKPSTSVAFLSINTCTLFMVWPPRYHLCRTVSRCSRWCGSQVVRCSTGRENKLLSGQLEAAHCCLKAGEHVGNAEVLFYPSSNIGEVVQIVLKLFIYQKMQNKKYFPIEKEWIK